MFQYQRLKFSFVLFCFVFFQFSCTGSYKIDCRPIDGHWIKKVRGVNGRHGRLARGLAAVECRLRCATAALYVPGKVEHHIPSTPIIVL
jgi:hypothetical protein